jgi:hypothetical protein
LKQALATNAMLIQKLGTNTVITPTNNTGGHKPFNQAEWESKLDPNGYCWSHGYKVQLGNNSKNCKGKMGGHKDNATREDIQGGSTRGKA